MSASAGQRRSPGRPNGSVGTIARALIDHAREPGTVRELAARAQVGFDAAVYTCSRLRASGELVAVSAARPAQLIAAAIAPRLAQNSPAWAQMLQRWFARTVSSAPPAHDLDSL